MDRFLSTSGFSRKTNFLFLCFTVTITTVFVILSHFSLWQFTCEVPILRFWFFTFTVWHARFSVCWTLWPLWRTSGWSCWSLCQFRVNFRVTITVIVHLRFHFVIMNSFAMPPTSSTSWRLIVLIPIFYICKYAVIIVASRFHWACPGPCGVP